ncbi:MAG: pirin family protein [Sandaracinaceae bacterium]
MSPQTETRSPCRGANTTPVHAVELSEPTHPQPLRIRDGFEALSFKHNQFHGLMDPLVMVDHFTMTEPTFGAHPHAGMSAVSVLFEDSEGRFRNRDSLGHSVDLLPGDLYWLKAGRGAVHDEAPLSGARTHALQIFVNLPARMKQDAPGSLHVPSATMPVIERAGARVRVVLGETQGIVGASSPALPVTILDANLEAGGGYAHELPAGRSAWLHTVRGDVSVRVGGRTTRLAEHEAVALRNGATKTQIELHSTARSQVVLLQGTPIDEPFVQQGPFVMSTRDELRAVAADHAAGRLGSID